ncbi:14838_t:CDS:2 [Funneliformis caledonium]|uniref:14838_t:CDS:1 n=1 Tax=Funneliformis caledonium TaxID=1117310 RepID=A0A9N8W1X7_9GLOM|nr:14838_t:CDS:2 [Funneliformis caledonium]
MKFSTLIAIIFGLLTSMSLTLIEADHKVWIHNKITAGTQTSVQALLTNGQGGQFASKGAIAHKGYSLTIPDNVSFYYLDFAVNQGISEPFTRLGPITNDGDKCYHFHGTLYNWRVLEC